MSIKFVEFPWQGWYTWPLKIPWLSMTFWKIPLPLVKQLSSFSSVKTIIYSTEIKHASEFYCLPFIENILIFHDFPWSTPKFQDFPGLENEIVKFHDFPGFPWPVRTLHLSRSLYSLFVGKKENNLILFLYIVNYMYQGKMWSQSDVLVRHPVLSQCCFVESNVNFSAVCHFHHL